MRGRDSGECWWDEIGESGEPLGKKETDIAHLNKVIMLQPALLWLKPFLRARIYTSTVPVFMTNCFTNSSNTHDS